MLMQVSLKVRQGLVERLVANARVAGSGIAPADFPQRAQGLPAESCSCSIIDTGFWTVPKGGGRMGLFLDHGLFHPDYVGEKDHFFFHHVKSSAPATDPEDWSRTCGSSGWFSP